MMPPIPIAADLCEFLQARLPLPPSEQEKEVPVLWRTPPHGSPDQFVVERVVLALDFRALTDGAGSHSYEDGDALFLHRPFQLPPDFWPDAPVFASHRGLDAHLSVGWNPALAQTLNLRRTTELRRDDTDAHPIGMVGDLPEAASFGDLLRYLSHEFGGMETALSNGRETISRLAIMGAMTPALIQKAADAGAHAYLTGQVRDIARKEAEERSLAVYATGHHRAEAWGLHGLARELEAAFVGLRARVVT